MVHLASCWPQSIFIWQFYILNTRTRQLFYTSCFTSIYKLRYFFNYLSLVGLLEKDCRYCRGLSSGWFLYIKKLKYFLIPGNFRRHFLPFDDKNRILLISSMEDQIKILTKITIIHEKLTSAIPKLNSSLTFQVID
jgi:hypothetical protein